MLHWQFLGTSAGIPTKKRNVSALALGQYQRKPWLLIDCGEATQHQLLHTDWSMHHLSAICITHVHGDHCYGLPGAIASASMHKRTAPLTIIAPDAVWQWLQQTIALTDMHLTYELQFIHVEQLLHAPITLDGFVIETHALNHRVPSHAFKITYTESKRQLNLAALEHAQVPKGKTWGLLQQGQDVEINGHTYDSDDFVIQQQHRACVIVAGDNDTPELLQDACVDVDVLIHEATYTQEVADKVGSFPMHSSAKQVATFAQNTGLPNLILTHFSSRYATKTLLQPLLQEAQQFYEGQVFLADDFQVYHLLKNGESNRLSLFLQSHS
ncbi:ribonuclease Z [Vitreoscilla stercoraria]|uniref:Ribonuclease Z n=1 Tax=Vitreoscilla stercoraria TaxID=61 RepID=A0ABY4E929_VITST|nr:ribonuclease Z [Vitreoscilla stercoraria]UOO91967.1 ribonuclease Z [Vitreoscilla stercoraria]